jgi:uncharacterized membrane protein
MLEKFMQSRTDSVSNAHRTFAVRLVPVDLVRGAIIILMVLDHTRDYFHNYSQYFKTTDLAVATPAIFFTRWITHFCAPGFVFLAGISIYLRQNRDSNPIGISSFLLLRGLLLIALEITVVRFAWDFTGRLYFYAQIMWVLGFCMMLMAFVVRPSRIAGLAAAMGVLYLLAHGFFESPVFYMAVFANGKAVFRNGFFIVFNYPIFQWFLVMIGGYFFGRVMIFDSHKRKSITTCLGIALIFGFLVLRIMDVLDIPWNNQASGFRSILAFLNCSKLPPSTPYLLMTVGIIVLFLRLADGLRWNLKPLQVFGRVPLLFYVAHLYLIHFLALIVTIARGQDFRWALPFTVWFPPPQGSNFGFGLPVVYLVSLLVVLILYPICLALNRLKQAKKYPWLSYL